MEFDHGQPYPNWTYYHDSGGAQYGSASSGGSKLPYWQLSLRKGDIRLLVMNPAEDPMSPIQCSLEQFPQHRTGKYVALSYRWGELVDDSPHIDISGRLVRVTKSLAHALQELRRQQHYRVWVDRLCINQHNTEELASQVERMGDIYRYASQTMAWLGFCRGSDIETFENARSLVTSLVAWGEKNKGTAQHKGKKSAGKSNAPSSPPPGIQPYWTELLAVFKREYWSRAWIIQEVTVSRRVEFFWNNQHFSVRELKAAIAACKSLAPTTLEARELRWSKEFQHVDRLMGFRSFRESPIRLLEALIRSRYAECSNPRDRLYALKHIASDGRDSVSLPNYEESLEALNRRTVCRLIAMYQDLDMVIFPTHVTKTWVPQLDNPDTWKEERTNNYLTGKSSFVPERSDCDSGSSRTITEWRATLGSRSLWRVDGQKGLRVHYKRIGRITQCSATDDEANQDETGELRKVSKYGARRVKHLISLCWLLYDLLPNKKSPDAKAIKIGDIHYLLTESVRKSVRKSVPGFYKWLFCRQNLSFKIDDVPLANWFCAYSDKTRVKTATKARRCYSSVQMGMRLFTTDHSNLGWATSSCRPGDELFLIKGCSVPVVLRKVSREAAEERYQMIGDSIVHGLMEGQGVTDIPFSSWPVLTLL
ncbi:Heterokaryon incompatibility protein 6, OR allele [Colletotrichum aenigma]|uniref:Heterokaryon incompatibility protein 6, OR allele n=1 Tax=Colletotrichum aenigma TaxID=1215731 RepID=UPI001872F687|nr:Heterokaryon incompatibility protein 6, OR allele [Colletotrichum aenigma]KAF5512574.1 Heterokaryon incompatibility protein 6, OR allele [Colletotrichum aenigma]